ncbi:MAG: ISL3 family transposase [Acidimicrobiales bacterium]
MCDGNEFNELWLGLPGFRVTAMTNDGDELLVGIETVRRAAGCPSCGVIARTKDRLRVVIRDLPCFDRRVKLVWSKRRFSCPEPECPQRTWTEHSDELPDRHVLSARAGREATRAVGEEARSVASLARWLGVAWSTVMEAVRHYGTPLVDDPDRVGDVTALGIDETAFLAANAEHATALVTGFVDLDAHVLIDMIEGNRAIDVSRWLSRKDKAFLEAIGTVACDLHEGYRAGLRPHLDHARQVADPFHVVAVANRCVDAVRRRVQNELLGHRGRKDDPLYKIRRVLLTGAERLNHRGIDRMALGLRFGDPHDEVLGAWLAKEYLRDVYLTEDEADAALLLDRVIAGCLADEVEEIVSLGNTLKRWRPQILAHHATGASNGPTEAMNLLVKKIKRCGHGFKSFRNYRLRVLLHCGGIKWKAHPARTMRARSPQLVA